MLKIFCDIYSLNSGANMDLAAVCRTCLSATNLYPIFVNTNEYKNYSSVIYTTTGAKVEKDDGLSQHMCNSCISFINSSLKFRKHCKDVEIYLINFQNKQTCDFPLKDEVKNCDTEIDVGVIEIKIELETCDNANGDPMAAKTTNNEDNETTIDTNETPNPEPNKIKVRTKRNRCNKEIELPYSKVYDENDKKQRVTCKLCSKNLSIRSIDYHMVKSHPGADERKVKCELCDSFVIKNKLKRHKVMMHGAGSFRCMYCKLEFHSKESLIDHMSTCTFKNRNRKAGESGRAMVECDVCNKRMQKASLRMHQKIKHAGQGPVCEHCGKRFANKLRLNEHLRAKHGYQKLPCSYCEFRAASALAIKNHERRHLGEQPFVCETCGAKFHAAYLLAQHRASHRPDKRYKCDQCSASFKANNNLHMHKRSCHSTTTYRCGVCLRSYNCKHYAVKHIRRVHGNVDVSILCEPISKEAEKAPSSD